jgi:hypothetical protein
MDIEKKPKEQAWEIRNPLVIMFQTPPDNAVVCHIHPGDHRYEEYGLLICDLVRHVAAAFKVEEDRVWEWVDKERYHPTTKVRQPS